MFTVESTQWKMSFDRPRGCGTFASWLIGWWRDSGVSEKGAHVRHYGFRVAGFRFDRWIVMPPPNYIFCSGDPDLLKASMQDRRFRVH
jgi:hypothetical protein